MGRQEIIIEVQANADPGTVYALLRNGAGWPDWSPLGSFELERAGQSEPEGLGAIRIFRTRRITGTVVNREEIVGLVPDRRFSYILLSGLPLRNYRADITLTPDGAGTAIHWRSAFDAAIPGTGWLFRRSLGKFIGQLVQGLADRAAVVAQSR